MPEPVTVLYFAWLREKIGSPRETLALPDGVDTVGRLVDHLVARGPQIAAAFERRNVIRCAVNQEFATFDHAVSPGDEVAFFPPVTGG